MEFNFAGRGGGTGGGTVVRKIGIKIILPDFKISTSFLMSIL